MPPPPPPPVDLTCCLDVGTEIRILGSRLDSAAMCHLPLLRARQQGTKETSIRSTHSFPPFLKGIGTSKKWNHEWYESSNGRNIFQATNCFTMANKDKKIAHLLCARVKGKSGGDSFTFFKKKVGNPSEDLIQKVRSSQGFFCIKPHDTWRLMGIKIFFLLQHYVFHLACLCQQKSCWKERERDRFNLGGEKKRNSGDFKCLRRFLPIFSRWITLKLFAELEKNATPNSLNVSARGVRFTKIFKCCPYMYFHKNKSL